MIFNYLEGLNFSSQLEGCAYNNISRTIYNTPTLSCKTFTWVSVKNSGNKNCHQSTNKLQLINLYHHNYIALRMRHLLTQATKLKMAPLLEYISLYTHTSQEKSLNHLSNTNVNKMTFESPVSTKLMPSLHHYYTRYICSTWM